MKTLKLTLIGLIILLSSSMYANEGQLASENVKIRIVNDKLVKINVKANENEDLKFEVLNNKGEQLMKARIEKNKCQRFSHKLNALEDGFYTYIVSGKNETLYTSRVVITQDGAIEYIPEHSKVNAFIQKLNEEQVMVNLIKEKNSSATIKVWDSNARELYAKQVKRGTVLRLTHDYSDFPEGTYSFGVFYDGELIALRKVTK